jgi:hypothetical protein
MPKYVTYSDAFQSLYKYTCTEPVGKNFDPAFKPELTPQEMLALGSFGGAYFIAAKELIPSDLPKSWFKGVKRSRSTHKYDELNYFGINASLPLSEWRRRGWIYWEDPHGWFQWYCRYYLGRRCKDDARQIKRWKAIQRHVAQLKKNCKRGDKTCRPKQRQTLLHWAYDGRKY